MRYILKAVLAFAEGQGGEWEAEGGVAPPAPLGATHLLDSLLHVDLHDFCHKFLADGVRPFFFASKRHACRDVLATSTLD